MFKIKETESQIILFINEEPTCFYHREYGLKELKRKIETLKERGLHEERE